MPKPNVIVIIADDMGYGDLSCVNHGLSCTPNLDDLASDSLRLTQAYSASCVCAPARAALMTGRYPHRTGCVSLNALHGITQLDDNERTLGDLFSHNGYRTGAVGKWHLGTVPSCHPNVRGFKEFTGFLPGVNDYYDWNLQYNSRKMHPDGRYLTDVLTDEAVEFIKRPSSDPFFLYLAYFTPHRPLQAPTSLLDRYSNRADLTSGQAAVYAMIESMDAGIGRILDALRQEGIEDNTIVMFTSDNGPDPIAEGTLSPRRANCGLAGSKYHVYEGGIRVPFLIRWPGRLAPDVRHDVTLHFTDVFPTLSSACDLELPGDIAFDGQDLYAAIEGRSDVDALPRFWQWNRYIPLTRCNAAMREGDWKLVWPGIPGYMNLTENDQVAGRMLREQGRDMPDTVTPPPNLGLVQDEDPELYHVRNDPGETDNLAKIHPARVDRMSGALDAWMAEVYDEFSTILARRFK